jgi:hypothetical protein
MATKVAPSPKQAIDFLMLLSNLKVGWQEGSLVGDW